MKRHTRTASVPMLVTPANESESSRRKRKILIKYEAAKTINKPEKHSAIKGFLIEYMYNSNLHGLKYVAEKERTLVEKIFWTVMILCSVVLCATLIQNIYIKWRDNPVIIGFDENMMPVSKIPHPTVTVCSETKALRWMYNFTDNFHLFYFRETDNSTERFYFEDISMVCEPHLSPRDGRLFSDSIEIVSHIKEVSPSLNDTFFACQWLGEQTENCSRFFSTVLTEQGLCYTFNSLSAEEILRLDNLHTDYDYLEKGNPNNKSTWSLENGYSDGTPILTYPHRGTGYGAELTVGSGLAFVLEVTDEDLDYLCRGPVPGFKIFLNNPAELPRASRRYFRAPLSQEVLMSVSPKVMITSDGLLDYHPNKRKCYFPNERYLHYFRTYTQANCEMECLSNFTYARCGCVHFGMLYGPNTTVCNAGSIMCVQKAQMELVTVALDMESVENNTIDDHSREIAQNCLCMPGCNSIEYEAEVSQANFDWKRLWENYRAPIPPNYNNTFMTRVVVFFKEAQFIMTKRSELYGETEFLANCGGLLGLFMGFSVLSIVEILYFLSLRIICVFWKKRSVAKSMNNSVHLNID